MAFDKETGLTYKQKAFVEAYISNGFNGTKAALAAGYSEKCPDVQSSENLDKPKIKAYMHERMQELFKKSGFNASARIEMLRAITNAAYQKDQFDSSVKAINEANKMEFVYCAEKEKENKVDDVKMDKGDEILDKCRKEY